MTLRDEDLTEIGDVLSATQGDADLFAALRARFPHLQWTRCDAADVDEEPFRTFGRYDIHLIDAHDHCVQITADPGRATGIVLAMRETA